MPSEQALYLFFCFFIPPIYVFTCKVILEQYYCVKSRIIWQISYNDLSHALYPDINIHYDMLPFLQLQWINCVYIQLSLTDIDLKLFNNHFCLRII